MSRPEHVAPPEIYYNDREARKYSCNSRIIKIQSQLSRRAIELLNLPSKKQALILDIGCGSGLSGEQLTRAGYQWVGIDISSAMLDIAIEREVEGDVFLQDMGQGVCFRPGAFDGAISVSALQWLCNADKSSHVPRRRLARFFETLYAALAHGARAVFQLYPESPRQIEMITACAMKAGFTGGMVIDFPNSTKAKKYFLCLFAGVSAFNDLPQCKTEMDISSDEEQHSGVTDDDNDVGSDDNNDGRTDSSIDGDDMDEDSTNDSEEQGQDSDNQSISSSASNRRNHLDTVRMTNVAVSRDTRESIKRRRARERLLGGGIVKSRAWIEKKKKAARAKGHNVRPDSKYSGRKRRQKF